jgi:hypothetical protein
VHLEKVPLEVKEALQQHLMGSFARVRKMDKRDLLFVDLRVDTVAAEDGPDPIDEDNEETD